MASSASHLYRSLATNNSPPTAGETAVVREQIETLIGRRRRLAQLLAQTQAQLQDNEDEIQVLRRICAPIRRLPLETLGEVFLRIPTSKMRPNNYQKVIKKVSLVCKSWRDAARFTAQLWGDMWVMADAPSLCYDTLAAWTHHAGSIAKSIEISSSVCGGVDWDLGKILCAGPGRCLFANPILAKLLKQGPGRWHSVTLNCPSEDCFMQLVASLEQAPLASGPSSWDFIRTFNLVVSGKEHWHWMAASSPLLSFLPNTVKNLRIQFPNWRCIHPVLRVALVWRCPLSIPQPLLGVLTSLELKINALVIVTSTIFMALEQCVNLEKLSIDFSNGQLVSPERYMRSPFPSGSVSLPRLQFLQLRQLAPEPASIKVLHRLKMPTLTDMSFSFDLDTHVDSENWHWEAFGANVEDNPAYDISSLTDFIRGDRATPSWLRHLHIRGATFYDGALSRILRELDELTHLKLEWMALGSPDSDDFFNLLKQKPKCLPQLKTIEIENLKYPTDKEIPFLRFFVEERGITLKLSLHDREAWEENDDRYLYLVGLESDSDYEDGELDA